MYFIFNLQKEEILNFQNFIHLLFQQIIQQYLIGVTMCQVLIAMDIERC